MGGREKKRLRFLDKTWSLVKQFHLNSYDIFLNSPAVRWVLRCARLGRRDLQF